MYEYYEQIGEGGFNKVFRAKFLPTGQIMAVKILKLATAEMRDVQLLKEQAKSEASILSQLQHESIVQVHHLIQLKGKLYMGMEYFGHPELFEVIK